MQIVKWKDMYAYAFKTKENVVMLVVSIFVSFNKNRRTETGTRQYVVRCVFIDIKLKTFNE